ncbi:hypothetical protein B0O80DRAFT_438733 [Mortierella sp. GBAus27b]|nr:hypothetical protein B0O80DRAFT_438733 [Mortierella sp. GBAus27b]
MLIKLPFLTPLLLFRARQCLPDDAPCQPPLATTYHQTMTYRWYMRACALSTINTQHKQTRRRTSDPPFLNE